MGHKRKIYSSHKHYWHLNRKKTARLNDIYRLLEIETLAHGYGPVDMHQVIENEPATISENNIYGGK